MCMKMDYSSVKYEVANRIATITMDVPEKMNALDARMGEELVRALDEAKCDNNVKVVVLTGSGKAFCAGGDVSVFPSLDLESAVSGIRDEADSLVNAFTRLPKPIIAAVNGFAVGAGLSLALISDIVIASDKAKFGAAFVNIGLIPDIGSLYYLPKLIGLQKAKELVFTGKNINAQEALNFGIVNTVVEHDQLAAAAGQLSMHLAGQPALAMASAKSLLHKSLDIGVNELIELEGLTQGVCMQSDDSREGVDAFINKRKPVFK